ncbi:MAG TPA: CCA tRNA nucleotidyltransferase [Longimicrobiales bacterium]
MPDLHPPAPVRAIARRLEDAGFETWAVGGAVRDALLGRPAGDWDLASRARPAEVRRLFRRTVPIGIEHGTVGVLGEDGVLYEVTTFRRDIETFGRHAVVEFADTIEEDLSRRDFTINALAWHPLTGELRDPFLGMEDLETGRLRTVGEPAERFAEDYLRVLRALRFAGDFELVIDAATWDALVAAVPHLVELSAERIREELWKILGKTRRASAALSLYAAAGALVVLYPELDRLVGLEPGDGAGHDAWTESLFAVDALPPARPLLRVAALLHGVGKPAARTRDLRGGWRYVGHEVVGAPVAEAVMRRLKASNADTDRVRRLVRHQSDLFPPDAPGAGVRRWLRDIGPDLVRDLFRLRFALWRAATVGRAGGAAPDDLIDRWRTVRAVLRQHPVLEVKGLAIGGADLRALGLEPGPEYGRILRGLLEAVIERPELNTREALLERVRTEFLR